MTRFLLFVPFLICLGCTDDGQIKAEDCMSICGGPARLELALNECERIPNERNRESCKLAAATARETCLSRCAPE